MKKAVFSNLLKTGLQIILLLAVSCFGFGTGSTDIAHAQSSARFDACGQLLAAAEASFLATLPADGSIPASPETKAAAQEYIRVSKLCYDSIEAQNSSGTLQDGDPGFIDDGGMLLGNPSTADYVLSAGKWGTSGQGTSGGTVTYSFMGNGISLSAEGSGTSVALSSLPGFQACFITDIQNAFAAWQAVSNIQFVQVSDNGAAFDAPGAVGDIRIGAHAFDGPSGTLAHAYFPPPNGTSAAGDMHFDSAENWKCNTSGMDIGIVALHEIGHTLGLNHENTGAVAVMDPYYNSSLTGLLGDDIGGAAAIYGPAQLLAPTNDNFANATTVGSIPYTNTVDTTGATEQVTPAPGDPQVNASCDGHFLNKGKKTVWYKYSPGAGVAVSIDTVGSDYDTYLAVWTGTALSNLAFVACDDDRDSDLLSKLVINAQAGTTYYIEVAGFAGYSGTTPQNNPGGTLVFNMNLTNVDVSISGSIVDRNYLLPSEGVRRTYDNIDAGPVKVLSTSGVLLIASQRINLKSLPNYLSYSEFMGIPASKLTDTYIFPWYNNATAGGLSSEILFGNVGSAPTDVTITIGTNSHGPFHLNPDESDRQTFTDIDAGPVQVKSSDGVPIVASMRVNLKKMTIYSSYSEFMGLPSSATPGTGYIFPWYNNATAGGLQSQLRFGNVGNATTTVTIKIGGVTQPTTYTLAPNESARPVFTNIDAGPVEVTSSGGVPIIASMRINLKTNPTYSSYSEFMGLPAVSLTETHYYFPWFNNLTNGGVESQLRFGNVGVAPTDVTVKIAGVTYGPFHLGLNGSLRVPIGSVDAGPVEVSSSGGVPIIASMRVNLRPNPTYSSYSEFMGLSVGAPLGMPGNELSTTYWFPWYNNANAGGLQSQLRFGRP